MTFLSENCLICTFFIGLSNEDQDFSDESQVADTLTKAPSSKNSSTRATIITRSKGNLKELMDKFNIKNCFVRLERLVLKIFLLILYKK
jgi:hypothetical protein